VNKEEHEKSPGLSRAKLVAAALSLIQVEGLDALSMRSLADRLNVKAASLYWHVRDRRELVELLAESILATVPATHRPSGWRKAVLDAGAVLGLRVAAQKDADRILL
jgi:TetR/AcrR family tetracycline transcriptional repressor